jgi:hypothetical protein
MATTKIRYVGQKQSETAFNDRTGITWTPEQVEAVDVKHAADMLKHPDVFALDEPAFAGLATAKGSPPPVVPPVPKVEPHEPVAILIALPDGKPVDLAGMDKEQLHALAKTHGVAVHHSAGPAKVIEALVAAFPA